MEVTFYIHKGVKNYVYASCYADDGRVRKSVCAYPYAVDTFPDSAPKAIKNKMSAIALRCDNHISNCNIGRLPITKKDIEAIIDLEAGRKPKEAAVKVSTLLQNYYNDTQSGKVLFNGAKLSVHKLRLIETTKVTFDNSGMDCRITDFDFSRWTNYLINYKKKNGRSFSKNTISLRQLVVMQAIRHGYGKTHNVVVEMGRITIDDVDIPCVYSLKELIALYNHSFTGSYEKARDIFVYGCFVGFRLHDYERHGSKDITDGVMNITTSKRHTVAAVPISPYVQAILDKYNGNPPKMNAVSFNKLIKKVCREAGFTEMLSYVRSEGGKKVERTLPKCDMTSFHTMRRSCATNMLNGCEELGIPPIEAEAVRKMMGWQTDKMIRKYNKAKAEDVARQKINHPLFNMKV